jgi:uncharacterized oligopeptide transporter (OPT) family protein
MSHTESQVEIARETFDTALLAGTVIAMALLVFITSVLDLQLIPLVGVSVALFVSVILVVPHLVAFWLGYDIDHLLELEE